MSAREYCGTKQRCLWNGLLSTWIACVAIGGWTIGVEAQASGALPPVPIDTVLHQLSFPVYVPIGLSADGVWLAYTVQSQQGFQLLAGREYTATGVPNAVQGCQVWVTNTRTGETIHLGMARSTSWAPTWSPDGQSLALYSDQDGGARLWIWERASRTLRRASDVLVRPYTTLEVPRWSDDGRTVVTRVVPYGMTLAAAAQALEVVEREVDTGARAPGVSASVYRSPLAWRRSGRPRPQVAEGTGIVKVYHTDLAAIDIGTGAVTTLARGYRPFDYWIAPGSHTVAFTSMDSVRTGSYRWAFDIMVVDLAHNPTSPPRAVTTGAFVTDNGMSVAWSPDGQSLAYATSSDSGEVYWVARLAGGPPARVATIPHDSTGGRQESFRHAPRWDQTGKVLYVLSDRRLLRLSVADGQVRTLTRLTGAHRFLRLVGSPWRSTAWSPDRGRSLAAVTLDRRTMRSGFARVDVRTGVLTQLSEADRYLGNASDEPLDVSADGRTVAYAAGDAQHPIELWCATAALTDGRQVTRVAGSLAAYQYGASRLIEWQTAAGDTVRGALLLPVGFTPGTTYPLIVYPYPNDPRSDGLNRFGLVRDGVENMQLFATRGYAVLAPDAPITLSRQMRSLAEVILPGVERVVELGIADSTRLGVMGHSWGGYTVLSLLVQTTRFKAGVMRGGVGDWPAFYGSMEPNGNARLRQTFLDDELEGTLWQQRERYVANSPVFLLDHVETPLLIVHGASDSNVYVHFADEVFADLSRLDRDVEYARYDGEDHWEGGWSYANERDYVARVLAWFDELLKR